MPLYIYRCAGGHETELLRGREIVSIPCPQCSATAERVSVYQTALLTARTPVGERPVSVRQYIEANEEVAYQHEKAGTRPPDVLAEAKRRVAKLRRAGITDSLDYRPDYMRTA